MKLQELLDKKHVLFCIKDVMVMQKDTADSHSVCPGEAVEYILPSFFEEMFHVHEYSCKHTESLYKLMATEQIVLFLSFLFLRRDWK